jgi:hypothetical protein
MQTLFPSTTEQIPPDALHSVQVVPPVPPPPTHSPFSHAIPLAQLPHSSVPPQPLATLPHSRFAALKHVTGTQATHLPEVHRSPLAHVPHSSESPQPSAAAPHDRPCAAQLWGTQAGGGAPR